MFGLWYGNGLYFGFRNFLLVSVPHETGFEPSSSVQVADLRAAGSVSGCRKHIQSRLWWRLGVFEEKIWKSVQNICLRIVTPEECRLAHQPLLVLCSWLHSGGADSPPGQPAAYGQRGRDESGIKWWFKQDYVEIIKKGCLIFKITFHYSNK